MDRNPKEKTSKTDKVLMWVFIPLYIFLFLGWVLKGCRYWGGF